MDKVVLLTGATGFIGRHAITPLLARGYQVHALSSRPVAERKSLPGVTWHRADLLVPGQIEPLLAAVAPSHLLHFAWYVEPGKFWSSPENLKWLAASLRLVQAFAEAGGVRAVFAGTCAEYDWSDAHCCLPQTPLRPATLYGATKLSLWLAVERFASVAGVTVAWGRIFSPYGPGGNPMRLVQATIRSLIQGEEALCTHGRQIRDFLYTADIADAFVALLDSSFAGSLDIASGDGMTVADVVSEIAQQIGRPDLVRLGALSASSTEPLRLVGDASHLRSDVGWLSQHTLSEGIAKTIEWWRVHL